uniref:Spindle pole body component 110 isoform X2 n=1 Tax=Nicotiana tabacum TaxID=4097 RepID=A0A1S3X0B2_TOBAC|nr:spindle pole body component 110 isoform X2 [Nicotiana tomentosiformis]XP_016433324.1 PREDICTED: spindle pole body component 110 isoform X2 [Nicotiana tabacum]
MAKPKSKNYSSERKNWNNVFNLLVKMLKSQQTQLEYLAKDRKILEDRIKLLHGRWVNDGYSYQEQIFQDFIVQEMEHIVEVAKAERHVVSKKRDAVMYKKKFEDADSLLADFRELLDYHSHKCSEPNDVPRTATNEKAETRNKAWEDEVRRLRTENERLTSEKNSEISALLAEKNFIWNQYNKLEHDMNEQLRSKHTEIELGNEKIHAFMRNIKELQSSNTDKDNTIATLRTEIAKLESDLVKKSEELFKLSRELELLKKSGSASVTPVLLRSTSASGPPKRRTDRKTVTFKEEPQSSQALEKRSSKRKAGDSISGAPKLFTSSFKVPKLKTSSPLVI